MARTLLELLLVEDLLSHIRPEFLKCLTIQACEETPPTACQGPIRGGDAIRAPGIREKVVPDNSRKAGVSWVPAAIAMRSQECRHDYMLPPRPKTWHCGPKIAGVLAPEGT